MEQDKKTKFIVTELSIINFNKARGELKKKGEEHLINFLDSCVNGNLDDANTYKKLFTDVERHIEFIDNIVERTNFPGNKRVKM